MNRWALCFVLSLCVVANLAVAQQKVWVYFADKGPGIPIAGALQKSSPSYEQARAIIEPRALARRAKILPTGALLSASDLPVYRIYLDRIVSLGGVLLRQSRWLNAATFMLTPAQRDLVSGLPFVKRVATARVLYGRLDRREQTPPATFLEKETLFDYGPSLTQVQAIGVPALHTMGLTGRGVLVGMLDTGFRWRVHESLRQRHVLVEHDFLFNRDTTANGAGDDPSQDEHGTLTFSTLAGYAPGKLIGPAFNADFILAKTELIYPSASGDYDTKIEEDDWAAGIEWMEAHGVDVVSSSLGYNTFVDTTSYTWQHGDFNGRTTVSALAALHAARLGVIVCNAMGNEGNGDGVVGTMITPADADSIISVGAVGALTKPTVTWRLASFSSTGPTNDGRIKPDVVAPGVGVYCASTAGPSIYFYESGTSLATPLTAGTATLLLCARPELTPIQVRDALRESATPVNDEFSFPTSPNNFTGWGMINALNALLSVGPILSDHPVVHISGSHNIVSTVVVSNRGVVPNGVRFHYAVGSDSAYQQISMTIDSAMFFATSGRYSVTIPPQPRGTIVRYYVDVLDSAGRSYRSPAAIRDTVWQLRYGFPDSGQPAFIPGQAVLYQNFPNPFRGTTSITYDLPNTEHVLLRIYNVLGEYVATLVDEVQTRGDANSRPPALFNGSSLPSGVYFIRITTPTFMATQKLVLLH